jgi:phospholipase/lecithinase/hemolysin
MILAKGAKYVVVINMPDLAKTTDGVKQSADTQTLLNGMSVTFNARLLAGIAGNDNVLLVDLFTRFRDWAANPGNYGLSNVTSPACDLTPAKNPLGSSLVCTPNSLIAGDTSKYLFADSVHPTPYGYSLFADYVMAELAKRKWN